MNSLKYAVKDYLRSGGTLLWYFLAVSLAVAALYTLRAWEVSFNSAIEDESRQLLGSDITLTSRDPEAINLVFSGAEQTDVVAVTTMLQAEEGARLSLLRGVDESFPLIGELVTEPASARAELGAGNGVVVDKNLAIQLELARGSTVRILGEEFKVLGVVSSVPGDLPFRTFVSPRLYIDLGKLKTLDIGSRGSRVFYTRQITVSENRFKEAAAFFRESSRTANVEIETREDREARFKRGANIAVRFFSIFSIVSLVLAGLSIMSGVHVLVKNKLRTTAILRVLGLTPNQTLGIFAIQSLVLSFLASVTGVVLGHLVLASLWDSLDSFVGLSVGELTWDGSLESILFGTSGTFLLSLFKLYPLKKIKPGVLFAEEPKLREFAGRDLGSFLFLLAVAVVVLLFFATSEDNFKILSFTFGGVIVLLAALRVTAWGFIKAVALLNRRFAGVTKLGISSLYRVGNNTLFLLTVMGVSICLAVFAASMRLSLKEVLSPDISMDKANGLLLDVQPYQLEDVVGLLEEENIYFEEPVGIVTMRLKSFAGKDVVDVLARGDLEYPRWLLSREFRVTERDDLLENESLLAGSMGGVSIADRMADRLKLEVGDKLKFNAFGEVVETSVDSIRKVEWTAMKPSFFVTFPTGALEGLPKVYLISVGTSSVEETARLQSLLLERFGNISHLDARELVSTVETGLGRLSGFISFFSFTVFLLCLVVLTASLLSTGDARMHETRLYKILGATPAQARLILTIEYLALGVLGVISGAFLGFLATVLASIYLLKTSPVLDFRLMVWSVVAGVVISTVTGFATERRAVS